VYVAAQAIGQHPIVVGTVFVAGEAKSREECFRDVEVVAGEDRSETLFHIAFPT
jgi:hypothetical protein